MCVCVCVLGPVTMERAEPPPNVSYFNPQQSVPSTRTQPRINKRGRGGRDAQPEKTAKYGGKRRRRDRVNFKKSV